MDGFHMYPFGFGWFGFGMIFWWVIFLLIGYLVYQDAEKRGMNGALWFILVILPMIGILFLILYVILREEIKRENDKNKESRAIEILKERYARGEISEEEFKKMMRELG